MPITHPALPCVSLVDASRVSSKLCCSRAGRSKRKTSAQVAFVNGERLLGEEAAALQARYPDKVYQRTRDLLGKHADHASVRKLLEEKHLPYAVSAAPDRGTVQMTVAAGQAHTAEELVVRPLRPHHDAPVVLRCADQSRTDGTRCCCPACLHLWQAIVLVTGNASMTQFLTHFLVALRPHASGRRPCGAQASILQYARRITEAATEGQPAVDCVIAVPPWFGPAQRQALLDAGQVFAGCPASRKLVERRHLS